MLTYMNDKAGAQHNWLSFSGGQWLERRPQPRSQ
jgi:hypothetical protein